MLQNFLGKMGGMLGGRIGGSLGGGMLSRIGRYVGSKGGSMLGGFLMDNLIGKPPVTTQSFLKYHNLRDSFNFVSAKYGEAIPLVFGRMRVQGKIIWLNKVSMGSKETVTEKMFKRQNHKKITTDVEFFYHLSFAVAICEGEIKSVQKVWNGDELLDIGNYKHRIYNGKSDQMPDPLIAAIEGEAPAFRDLAYIVFEEIPLSDFGDTIPNLSFEVVRKAKTGEDEIVEDMIDSMIMIPGSGEYVYDTLPQKKIHLSSFGNPIYEKLINVHNNEQIADAVASLNQLQDICSNVKWVAPVACWFGSSVKAGECVIRPCVEFIDPKTQYTDIWKVGPYTRENTPEVSRDQYGLPNYGGSVNDASIVRYLTELKRRGLKVMFYPMFFIDMPDKPWRGRLTGSPDEVRNFFTKKHGYNEFILHYANLVKNHVDAFVIGSELIGLTKVKDNHNHFPAIDELVKLAAQVKQIVGARVQVTYAADWSEYHHTDGGWYNLDPLWSSPNIDFIGIDAYFPITASSSSDITDEQIAAGFASGEGYDYVVDWDNGGRKTPISAPYAWKNLRYWWENQHKNPDGKLTAWQPKSKKIWFTEYGFPSIDKAPNQPNVFFDPECIDGGVPRHSNGRVNFSIQRRCIKEFIKYWGEQEYIGEMFLWTWDARPIPAYPFSPAWADSALWEKGHWVSGKLGSSSLAAIIQELSKRAGINLENVDTNTIDQSVEGFIINSKQTCRDVINTLRSAYFFDIHAGNDAMISFRKRGRGYTHIVSEGDLVKLDPINYIQSEGVSASEVLSKVNVHYINNLKDFEEFCVHVNSENDISNITEELHLPISMSPNDAERLGGLVLQNASAEKQMIAFTLPADYVNIMPTDYVQLRVSEYGLELLVRIIEKDIDDLQVNFAAIIDDLSIYQSYIEQEMDTKIDFRIIGVSKFRILELPFFLPGETEKNLIAYYYGPTKTSLEARIDERVTVSKITTLTSNAVIGSLVEIKQDDEIVKNIAGMLSDEVTEITIHGVQEGMIPPGTQIAKLGKEYIRFNEVEYLPDERCVIAGLSRGEFDTVEHCYDHQPGEEFILLSHGGNFVPVTEEALGKTLLFRANDLESGEVSYNEIKERHKLPYLYHYVNSDHTKLHVHLLHYSNEHDSWRSYGRDSSTFQYRIMLSLDEDVQEVITDEDEVEFNISECDLSAEILLDIVSIPSTNLT